MTSKYSKHISSIPLNPGAFPRNIDSQYPLSIDRTKMLSVSKCNLWRACVKEATYHGIWNHRPMCLLDKKIAFQYGQAWIDAANERN